MKIEPPFSVQTSTSGWLIALPLIWSKVCWLSLTSVEKSMVQSLNSCSEVFLVTLSMSYQWLVRTTFWARSSYGDGRNSLVCRSEEHTSELQSLMRISYAVFCLKKKKQIHTTQLNTCQINRQLVHTTHNTYKN